HGGGTWTKAIVKADHRASPGSSDRNEPGRKDGRRTLQLLTGGDDSETLDIAPGRHRAAPPARIFERLLTKTQRRRPEPSRQGQPCESHSERDAGVAPPRESPVVVGPLPKRQ